jgi:hypothetical protein
VMNSRRLTSVPQQNRKSSMRAYDFRFACA